MSWPRRPIIYEIDTWAWLEDVSRRAGRAVTLGSVPPETWDELKALRVDAVWLMGVWERSPIGARIARNHDGLQAEFRRALADCTPDDIVGSPYCVRRYVVDSHLGGPSALAVARRQLADRGLRLLLDFVPNHVALDHPWVAAHPEYFIRGTLEDLSRTGDAFYKDGEAIFAYGRDPYFPPWQDVLQLNAFASGLRQAVIETLRDIARQCDGVRCDMAMLLITRVFAQTWAARTGPCPTAEYWREVIDAVQTDHRDFLFVAEAYWDLEWELMQQGFDYCYDKRLYDRLAEGVAEPVRLHLLADVGYQDRLVRFIENHDEPRAAVAFPGIKGRAAAVAMLTLPGARLLHEGQLEGRRIRLPVQCGRRMEEPVSVSDATFYRRLLDAVHTPAIRKGVWRLCERHGWPDNHSFLNIVAWCWQASDERLVVAINLSNMTSQARVHVPWDDMGERCWRLTDPLSGLSFDRSGDEIRDQGLYVELPGWGYHFFRVEPLP